MSSLILSPSPAKHIIDFIAIWITQYKYWLYPSGLPFVGLLGLDGLLGGLLSSVLVTVNVGEK